MLRTYRVPVIVTFLMVFALGFWALRTWEDIAQHEREMQRRVATASSEVIAAALKALVQEGALPTDQARQILGGVIANVPWRFVIIEQEGARLVEVGTVPEGLAVTAEAGEKDESGYLLFWRKIMLQGEQASTASGGSTRAGFVTLDPGGQLLILGLEKGRRDAADRERMPPPVRDMAITIVVALLFIGASFLAWVMAIRGGILAEQLRSERARRAHLEELGLASAGLAHETKNPLGIISGLAQRIINSGSQSKENAVMLEHILDEVDKASSRLGDFMAFARQREPKTLAFDIQNTAAKVAEVLRPDFDAASVRLQVVVSRMVVLGDEEMVRQILVNLFLNSLHASTAGGLVELRAERQGNRAKLIVSDQGSGITEELLPDIFKPYIAGNASGHGLGLAVVKRFVEELGWDVSVETEIGRGSRFIVSGIQVATGRLTEGAK